jgi:hypothetical protein
MEVCAPRVYTTCFTLEHSYVNIRVHQFGV